MTTVLERETASSARVRNESAGKKDGKGHWLVWASIVADRMQELLAQCNAGTGWKVMVRHLEHVKSYGPHVDHLVVDLECRPAVDSEQDKEC